MNFLVRPAIADCASLSAFFQQWQVGAKDLIVTNEHLLAPRLNGKPCVCDTLYQEKFGKGEPSDEMVDAMLAAIQGKSYDRIIAVGGGTVIDTAKLLVFGDGLDCEAIFAKGATLSRKRSLVVLPTTCGTGSEATGISIIEFKKKQTKLGLALPALYADEAVLVPSLLETLPYEVFAASSIDALIHAVESYVSPKANPFTRAMGHCAIKQILVGYQAMDGRRELPRDMGPFLTASTMAGIAFGNAGCAAVHALSYPIGGNWHVPHGEANYLVFAGVFAAYRELGAGLLPLEAVLADTLGCRLPQVWDALFGLLDDVLVRRPLRELGADEAKCAEMAASVTRNQQRLLGNNPIELSEEKIKAIYMGCM